MSILPTTKKVSKEYRRITRKPLPDFFSAISTILIVRKIEKVHTLYCAVSGVFDKHGLKRPTNFPFALPGNIPREAIIYSNFAPALSSYRFHPELPLSNYFYPALSDSAIAPIIDQIHKDKDDPKASIKWATHIRGKKFLFKRETMTLPRFLQRYFADILKDKKDHELRDIAEEVVAQLTPADVVLCEKPEDYIKMYRTKCYSCVGVVPASQNHHGPATGKFWHSLLEEQNVWPTVWYHYNPHTQGVFSVRGDEPVARAFILKDAKGVDIGFGGVYAINDAERQALMAYLTQDRKLKNNTRLSLTASFKVPGIKSSKGYVCPMPHCDDIAKGFKVAFDKETQEFIFNPPKEMKSIIIQDTYRHNGYINEKEIL